MSPKAILFDLDGTLLDTAKDILYALNQLRHLHGLTELTLPPVRPLINLGAKAMIEYALNIQSKDEKFAALREQFIYFYQQNLANTTQFFPNMDTVLKYLECHYIPWGIVTNKSTHHTHAILKALKLYERPACIICGDTLNKHKPDPAPILYACKLLKLSAHECLYIGDSLTDVKSSKAAQTRSLIALYGYIDIKDDPFKWEADGYIHEPIEIIEWLN